MSQIPEFGRRVIVTCDAKGYGSSDELTQHQFQEAIPALLRDAAEHSGLDRGEWHVQSGGDGEMAVLPVTAGETRLLDRYVPEVAYALRRHNHNRTEAGRLRLRMVVHHGSAVSSPSGYSGNGIVTAARVVDSDALRDALRDSGADLVVAVTAPVYQDVVAQGHTRLRPEDFALTAVSNKEYEEPVWVHVPGRYPGGGPRHAAEGAFGEGPGNAAPPAAARSGASPTPPPVAPSAAPTATAPSAASSARPAAPDAVPDSSGPGPERRDSPAITNVLHGGVEASHAVFGVSYQGRS
ncbi:hypothetical protein [Nocardiopsis dassonvillei]|uniref:hypothetical protein n=1 Tax=Nocardiopsis dassonvillei TaxID=2014 RepID=UPI00363C0FDE